MKLKTLSAALIAAFAVPAAFAAIAPGGQASGTSASYNGNGELFVAVFDSDAKVSYTLDLGVTQNAFWANGQKEAGASFSWVLNDAAFTNFLGQVSAPKLQWSVLAFDTVGSTTGKASGADGSGGYRLFNTVRAGDESLLGDAINGKYLLGMGSSQGQTFFSAINTTGTHGQSGKPLDFTVNGSSVNFDADPGNAYYGDGSTGLSTTLNGNFPFSMGNAVGTASNFFFITRSGPDANAAVFAQQFGNSTEKGSFQLAATAGVANSYTLTYSLAAAVPEPETYAMLAAGLLIVGSMVRRRVDR